MKGRIKKIRELLIKSILMVCGTVSTITVLLIIIFLFSEGAGLFSMPPLDEGYKVVVHKNNPVKKLDASAIRKIHERDILNWKELGGSNDSIILFSLADIEEYYTEEQLGSSFEYLPQRVKDFVDSVPGVIAVFPERYLSPGMVEMKMDNIDVGEFLSGRDWYPTAKPSPQVGVLPIILGTLWVTFGAIMFALPLGLSAAIYMAEIAHPSILKILKPTIELLAGIPSVVYGFFGLVIVVPFIQRIFDLSVGETALAGSIILGIIALPTIITLAEDSIRSTPRAMKEASLALGATHWQTIIRVIIPYSLSGITSASILGVGRAIGETMAVLMVTGNAAKMPTSFLEPIRTIPATIAAELGEAPAGGLHYKALFILGCILFIMTFIINIIVELISARNQFKKT